LALNGNIKYAVSSKICYVTVDSYYAASAWGFNIGDTRNFSNSGDLPKAAFETCGSLITASGGAWQRMLTITVNTNGVISLQAHTPLTINKDEHLVFSINYLIA
jgi:hypothetical protein